VQNAALRVVGGQLQAFKRDLVIVRGQRAVLEQQLDMVLGLIGVARQDALVEALDRRHRRAVAQQHGEEL
jgi:hypothetical protein